MPEFLAETHALRGPPAARRSQPAAGQAPALVTCYQPSIPKRGRMFAPQDQDTYRSARPCWDGSCRRLGPRLAGTLTAAIATIATPALPTMLPVDGASARHNGGGHAAAGFFRLGRRGGGR
jgi:hypothetical protein